MTGQTIAQYEILERLGAGAMGVVYKARDVRLGRTVAIKILAPHLSQSKVARDRFLFEARAISILNHPNIATLYEVCELDGEIFLVFEYLAGGTLRDRIIGERSSGSKMPLPMVFSCAEQLAAGLACAAEEQILHRDLKPANLMFSSAGVLKITDFGLSKFLEDSDATRSDGIAGTAAYMSPEQRSGLDLDHRSDLYSAGVVIYEMLAGRTPGAGNEAPLPLKTLRPDTPDALVRILEHALEKDRTRRYSNAAEMLSDLHAAQRGIDVSLHAPVRKKRRWLSITLLACLLAAVPFLFPPVRARMTHVLKASIPQQKHLAVLPFVNIGADQTFCDGLLELVTSKLGQIEQFHGSLAVVPASEIRSQKTDSGDAARRTFGSNLVLTGSVTRFGDDVRLVINLSSTMPVKLINTTVVTAKWSNLLELQDSVVNEVTKLLDVELAEPAQGLLAAGQTSNPGAYRLYLEALGYMSRFDKPGNLDKAMERLQEAVTADPKYAIALAELGRANMIRWDVTKDRRWLDEARTLAQRALDSDSRVALAHVVMGSTYSETGDFPRAIQEFQRALDIDPLEVRALHNLADAYQSTGKPKEAELLFKKVVKMRPTDWLGYDYLAYFYLQQSRYSDAEPVFRKVIELAPGNPWAQEGLGTVLSFQGKYPQAQTVFEKAIKDQPTAALWTDLGAVLYNQGRFLDAAHASEKALEYDKSNYQYVGNLADCYRWTKEYRDRSEGLYLEAIRLTESVLEVNPKDATVLSDRAVYRAKLGQYKQALDDITRSRKLAPEDSNVTYKAAIVYALAGRTDEALGMIQKALQLNYSISDVRNEPELAGIRKDPGFEELLAKFRSK